VVYVHLLTGDTVDDGLIYPALAAKKNIVDEIIRLARRGRLAEE
jgi:hypothetical protein